jgi:hypothetical protein
MFSSNVDRGSENRGWGETTSGWYLGSKLNGGAIVGT